MISSEVQRTLVKSPPELWAELSDPDSLARHLGELGDVRITRTQPERTIEWTAENAQGTVSIKPSGWGTKVTLAVTRTLPQAPGEAAAEQAEAVEAGPLEQAEAVAEHVEPGPEQGEAAAEQAEAGSEAVEAQTPSFPSVETTETDEADAVQTTTADAAENAEPRTAEPFSPFAPRDESRPRRGFFARLFKRARPEPPAAVESPAVVEQPEAEPPQSPVCAEAPEPVEAPLSAEPPESPDQQARDVDAPAGDERDLDAAPAGDAGERAEDEPGTESMNIAAELAALEEQTTAVLTAVLDRLGAAHHRPFSRS